MAKILVADDNSNIQKMVGLALKDQGIEVVAVGNGEAAVRKISDIRPDLVLADVFMPVRNGYEVCKYVKDDPALSHIPVILLVGAFDPLDEQEAQRVGADGVLKKPFVPPDPLISMVKSALARAGVLASEKTAEAPPIRAADMIGSSPSAPTIMATIPAMDSHASNGDSADEIHRVPDPVRIDSGAPLAFGSLLETPVVKEEEEDQGFVAGAHPELSTERDWRSADETEESEEDEEPKSSWRRGGENEALEDPSISSVVNNAARDWRDAAIAEIPTRRSSRETWEPSKEKTPIIEAAEAPVSPAAKETFSAPTPISVSKPATPAAPFASDAWAAAISAGSNEERSAIAVSDVAPEVTSVPTEVPASIAAPAVETVVEEERQPEAAPEPAPRQPSMAESWFSPAPSPWDAEIKKASQLASGWDSPSGNPASSSETPVAAPPVAEVEAAAPVLEPSAEVVAHEAGISSYAFEAIREEAAIVTETATADVAEPAAASPAAIAEPKMDDLVAKVLARMSPEVLQAVTREILKPVVEALVRDELNAKKS